MELFEQIKEDEGFRRYIYKCSAGAWTIGYGRNVDPGKMGPGISEDEAAHLLRNDLAAAEMTNAIAVGWIATVENDTTYTDTDPEAGARTYVLRYWNPGRTDVACEPDPIIIG